jgi:hypothetical protein
MLAIDVFLYQYYGCPKLSEFPDWHSNISNVKWKYPGKLNYQLSIHANFTTNHTMRYGVQNTLCWGKWPQGSEYVPVFRSDRSFETTKRLKLKFAAKTPLATGAYVTLSQSAAEASYFCPEMLIGWKISIRDNNIYNVTKLTPSESLTGCD